MGQQCVKALPTNLEHHTKPNIYYSQSPRHSRNPDIPNVFEHSPKTTAPL